MKPSPILLFALAAAPAYAQGAEAREVDCVKAEREARRQRTLIPAAESHRRVDGNGRLYFHSAPTPACRIAGLFVIAGDPLYAYSQVGPYTDALYINLATGREASGWVESARLAKSAYNPGAGPSPEIAAEKGKALYSALRASDIKSAKLHILRGANIHTAIPPDEQITAAEYAAETPLELAVQKGYTQLVRLMLRTADDANKAGTDLRTPLMHAIRAGNTEMVSLLITRKADPQARTGSGQRTVLMQAADAGSADIVKLLLAAGAEAEATDKYGKKAADYARGPVIKQLLERAEQAAE